MRSNGPLRTAGPASDSTTQDLTLRASGRHLAVILETGSWVSGSRNRPDLTDLRRGDQRDHRSRPCPDLRAGMGTIASVFSGKRDLRLWQGDRRLDRDFFRRKISGRVNSTSGLRSRRRISRTIPSQPEFLGTEDRELVLPQRMILNLYFYPVTLSFDVRRALRTFPLCRRQTQISACERRAAAIRALH